MRGMFFPLNFLCLLIALLLVIVKGYWFNGYKNPIQSRNARIGLSLKNEESVMKEHNKGFNVAVLGASGGIGQPLSLLLKLDSRISKLSLFDVVRTPGVAADLSHINTHAQVSGYVGFEQIEDALKDMDVVLITAGVPRQPGMTRDDLFHTNAVIIKKLAEACAVICPKALFLVITNPVNSMVPIFAEILRQHNAYNARKLFGVTTLDIIRANTFVAENQQRPVEQVQVNVIGGHAGTTILPLLSQVPGGTFSAQEIEQLTHRIQFGGDEVVKAKNGAGSATLSMAYAAQQFTSRVLQALRGEKNIIECSFVENSFTPAPFFSTPVHLGREGIEEILPYGPISSFEQQGLEAMLPELIHQAEKGLEFVHHPPK